AFLQAPVFEFCLSRGAKPTRRHPDYDTDLFSTLVSPQARPETPSGPARRHEDTPRPAARRAFPALREDSDARHRPRAARTIHSRLGAGGSLDGTRSFAAPRTAVRKSPAAGWAARRGSPRRRHLRHRQIPQRIDVPLEPLSERAGGHFLLRAAQRAAL